MKFESLRPLKGSKGFKRNRIEESWQRLLKTGSSFHSPAGTLCAELLNRCVQERRSFALYYIPNGGYTIILRIDQPVGGGK